MKIWIGFIGLAVFAACGSAIVEKEAKKQTTYTDQSLTDYWYQGKAEVNSYNVKQNRYNATHDGKAVLVFVTEDFLTDKQVKNDRAAASNSTPILKTNKIVRFTTGLYDYSIMQSVFSPVKRSAFPHALKTTTSVQDWCGQVFMQTNIRNNVVNTKVLSYFESEGDTDSKTEVAFLEDEIMNLLRMSPENLPLGKTEMYPSAAYCRLVHKPFKPYAVTTSLTTTKNESVYTIQFEDLKRVVKIMFKPQAPYQINGWTDTYPSVFDGTMRTTIASLDTTQLLPYWSMNDAGSKKHRESFGLQPFLK